MEANPTISLITMNRQRTSRRGPNNPTMNSDLCRHSLAAHLLRPAHKAYECHHARMVLRLMETPHIIYSRLHRISVACRLLSNSPLRLCSQLHRYSQPLPLLPPPLRHRSFAKRNCAQSTAKTKENLPVEESHVGEERREWDQNLPKPKADMGHSEVKKKIS